MKISAKRQVFILLSITLGMLALSFAFVPLYNIFCKATGYGGTPRIANSAFDNGALHNIGREEIEITFDANLEKTLDWEFIPKQRSIRALPGQTVLVFYEVYNKSEQDIAGMAVYNISPQHAGNYFIKVECFCFEEQLIKAKQRVLMPVSFYVDPAIEKEKPKITSLTLSYTFFKIPGKK